ncbi:hypothetical protein LOZ12_005481 [Ophidiomyces ophidiicola]|nr:hypothetical protein LOZ62_002636 [Ophidiomyces ophidiicola]KAI2054009.1 hypothetical protein LOZ38_001538 [Ophidiomyces ophidiicola]KAI2070694.1 hypothetical protein LOZ37_004884 [Ophidiomyces ophidiicola]KAI2076718.1 hypothetical protein LOZ39_002622 [Ophidiomyces ophidiicola]KAI2090360.1 hypothetical protein LOZ35_005256 [Ophidiomyces ophidiicola]
MNRNDSNAPKDCRGLGGFYSYKNTFDEDSVWLEIPKQVTFINVTDPYTEKLDISLNVFENTTASELSDPWHGRRIDLASQSAAQAHGLEALSAAAAGDAHGLQPQQQASIANAAPLPGNSAVHTHLRFSQAGSQYPPESSIPPPNPANPIDPPSPSASITSTSNINLPSRSVSPYIDPTLRPPDAIVGLPVTSKALLSHTGLEQNVETDIKIAFLLRHFSESPGKWMDLFDLGAYFASYVPAKAFTTPVLRYAACAYAAKHLSRVKGMKGKPSILHGRQPTIESWPGIENTNWHLLGAAYYAKAIQFLMETLQHDGRSPTDSRGGWHETRSCDGNEYTHAHNRRRRFSNGQICNIQSDEVLTATAILSVYEFLDATGLAWNRHLSGVKSLLDISEIGMMSQEQRMSLDGASFFSRARPASFSRARKATFWNFARQDYLSAFINKCKCRLDTDDLFLWKEAGLLLDGSGLVQPSNTSATTDSVMAEDMVSNAMVWLSSKIVNYVVSTRHADTASATQWLQLKTEMDTWYCGLPEAFRPCARIDHYPPSLEPNQELYPFTKIWYSMPMCASAMQHYHMARILLLANKPPQLAIQRATMANRPAKDEIQLHCHEICGISMSRPEASVRINSVQPLFVSGQCLTDSRKRQTVLNLLRGIESDLGWATEYRTEQLLEQWGRNHGTVAA